MHNHNFTDVTLVCEDDVYHIEWRCPFSGDPVPGLLPGSGQHGTHPHPHPRLYLLLQPGGKHTAPSEKAKINKKLSPSTLRRNQRRKQHFQKQKGEYTADLDITSQAMDTFQCE